MTMKSNNLTGRVALVCGASDGIGAAVAIACAEAGARVVLVARREAALRKVAQSLPGKGHEIYFLRSRYGGD